MKNRAPIVIAIIILHVFFLSCANETNQTKTSTTNSKVSNNLHTESDEKMGHLVGCLAGCSQFESIQSKNRSENRSKG